MTWRQVGLGFVVLLSVTAIAWAAITRIITDEVIESDGYHRFPGGIAIGDETRNAGCINWSEMDLCFFVDLNCDYFKQPDEVLMCGGGSSSPPCLDVEAACTENTDCCTGLCVAGMCSGGGSNPPCLDLGAACDMNTDCCTGVCTDSVCATTPEGVCSTIDLEIGDVLIVPNMDVLDGDATMFEADAAPASEGNFRSTTWERKLEFPLFGQTVCGSDYCTTDEQVSLAPTPEASDDPVYIESGELFMGECKPYSTVNGSPSIVNRLGCGYAYNGSLHFHFQNLPADSATDGTSAFNEVIQATAGGKSTSVSSLNLAGDGGSIILNAGIAGYADAGAFDGFGGGITLHGGECSPPYATEECAGDVIFDTSHGTGGNGKIRSVGVMSWEGSQQDVGTYQFNIANVPQTIVTVDPCSHAPSSIGSVEELDCHTTTGCDVQFSKTRGSCQPYRSIYLIINTGQYELFLNDSDNLDVEGSHIVLGQGETVLLRASAMHDLAGEAVNDAAFRWTEIGGSHRRDSDRGGLSTNYTKGSRIAGSDSSYEGRSNIYNIPDAMGIATFPWPVEALEAGTTVMRLTCGDPSGCVMDNTSFVGDYALETQTQHMLIVVLEDSTAITIPDNITKTTANPTATITWLLAGDAVLSPGDTLALQLVNMGDNVGIGGAGEVDQNLAWVEVSRSNN